MAYDFVFDPVLSTEMEVRDKLRTYHTDNGLPSSSAVHHPVGRQTFMRYMNGGFDYITLPTLSDQYKYIDGSNVGIREDNIRERMKQCHQHLPSDYLSENVMFKEISDTTHLRTYLHFESGTFSRPAMFVLSNYWRQNYTYFDTVISLDVGPPALYYNISNHKSGAPIYHSGDKHDSANAILLQYMTLQRRGDLEPKSRRLSGVIYFHAYKKKTFTAIKHCEPNICIVDHGVEGSKVTINVLHFNMAEDVVGTHTKAAVARFTYNPVDKCVDWIIPAKPVYFSHQDDVGADSDYDTNSIPAEDHRRVPEASRSFRTPFLPSLSDGNLNDGEQDTIVIAQASTLSRLNKAGERISAANANFVEEFVKNDRVKYSVTFHQNIGPMKDELECGGGQFFVDGVLSLPIGGCSTVSGVRPILKLGGPPTQQAQVKSLSTTLRKPYRKTPTVIVFVTDDYMSVNAPRVHHQLNAIYIVMTNANGSEGIENTLNRINTSMAVALQGPISVTLVYLRGELYFLRGVWDMRFGEKVGKDLHDKFSLECIPLITRPQRSGHWPIYSPYGGQVIDYWPNDGVTFLQKVINLVNHELGRDTLNHSSCKSMLKFIFGQIEGLIEPDQLKIMANECLSRLEAQKQEGGSTHVTRAQAIDALIESPDFSRDYPDILKGVLSEKTTRKRTQKTSSAAPASTDLNLDNDDGEEYDRPWLNRYLYNVMGVDPNGFRVTNFHRNVCVAAHKIMKASLFRPDPWGIAYEVIQSLVAGKGSYGQRGRGVEKALHTRRVEANVAALRKADTNDINDFIEDNCLEEGVAVFALDIGLLKAQLLTTEEIAHSISQSFTPVTYESKLFRNQGVGIIQGAHACSFIPKLDLSIYGEDEECLFCVPFLHEFIKVMSSYDSITHYNFRGSVLGGPADYTRILLRRTMARVLNDDGGGGSAAETNFEENSGLVGKACLLLLSSLVRKLADMCTENSDENCSTVKRLRSVLGLFLSFMASGKDFPLSSLYTLFSDNAVGIPIPKRSFMKERQWLYTILKALGKIKIPCIQDTVKDTILELTRGYLFAIKAQYQAVDKKTEKKKSLDRVARFTAEAVLPTVLYIISLQHKGIYEDDQLARNATKTLNQQLQTLTNEGEEENLPSLRKVGLDHVDSESLSNYESDIMAQLNFYKLAPPTKSKKEKRMTDPVVEDETKKKKKKKKQKCKPKKKEKMPHSTAQLMKKLGLDGRRSECIKLKMSAPEMRKMDQNGNAYITKLFNPTFLSNIFSELSKHLIRAKEIDPELCDRSSLFRAIEKCQVNEPYVDKVMKFKAPFFIAFDYYHRKSNILLPEWNQLVMYSILSKEGEDERHLQFRILRCKMFQKAIAYLNPLCHSWPATYMLNPVLAELHKCDKAICYDNVVKRYISYSLTDHDHFFTQRASTAKVLRSRGDPFLVDPDVQYILSFLYQNIGVTEKVVLSALEK